MGGQRFVDPLGTSPTPGTTGPTGNRSATAAMVCGLIGVVIAWMPIVVVAGIVLGILAVVLGAKGLRQSKSSGSGRGKAITGLVTGVITLGLSVIGVWLTVDVFGEVIAYVEPGPRLVDDVVCTVGSREANVTGTITNLDDERRDYVVFVTVERTTRYAEIADVEPDETVDWSVRLDGSFRGVGDCEPDIVVNGPFPYGIETDPYRD